MVCGPGKIAPDVGFAVCNHCPSNTINTDGLDGTGGSADKHDGKEDCADCERGQSSNQAHTLCENCKAGTQPGLSG